MRADLEIISEWIQPGTRVLDLGCGDGTLLEHLSNSRDVTGYGLEIDDDNIIRCIERGVQVIKTDLDAGLADFFDEDSFDYVVMTQTLQAVRYPADLLDDMLRVGREGIVSFPNFGHWSARLQIALGRMPVSETLPYEWYETPNVHHCTISDFEDLCRRIGIKIRERLVLHDGKPVTVLPNLLGSLAVYRCTAG